jgi:hypothetical protein
LMMAVAPKLPFVVVAVALEVAPTATLCEPPGKSVKLDGENVTFATDGAFTVIAPEKLLPVAESTTFWVAPPGVRLTEPGWIVTLKSCVADGGGPPCRVTFHDADAEPAQEGTPGIAFRLNVSEPLPLPFVPSVPFIVNPTPPGAELDALIENEPPLLTEGGFEKLAFVSKSAEHPLPLIWPLNDRVGMRFELTVIEMLFA